MKTIKIDGVEYNLTPAKQKKTMVEWLKMLPEPYSTMAISQINKGFSRYKEFPESLDETILFFNDWDETKEGSEFWFSVSESINKDNIIDHSKLPPIPSKKEAFWEPKEGKEYFYIAFYGYVLNKFNNLDDFDKHLISTGNCFKTEVEAEEYRNKQIFVRSVLKFIAEENEKCDLPELDWEDNENCKYRLYYNHESNMICITITGSYIHTAKEKHFKTKEIGEKIIKKFDKEKLKNWFI